MPYGFPTGGELADIVCRELADDTHLRRLLFDLKIEALDVLNFRRAFRSVDGGSLDAFVESRRDYLQLVKAAIAGVLCAREDDKHLYPDADNRLRKSGDAPVDWFSYLFNRMRTPTAETFANNQLRIITFNFDRSFERRLFLAVRDAYGLSHADASTLAQKYTPRHLHGMLGAPNWFWLPAPGILPRSYEPAGSISDVAMCVEGIRLVHEEINPQWAMDARDDLEWAKQICFLGFGFHPINVSRLRLNESLPRATITGTALGFTPPELQFIEASVKPNRIGLYPEWKCLEFLRNVPVLQG